MKYKVVSLILIIPLVLMFCVFSASNIAALNVPISVSSVSLFHEEQEVVNLAQGNEFQINAQVYPRNASNKGLIYSYEVINKGVLPETSFLEINETGLVKVNSCGTAKISVTTKDGAYKKSFILEVVSTKATDMVANISKTGDVFVGDVFSLLTKILPEEALDKNVIYSSSNSNVISINKLSGECRAISSGRATITATLENGLNGKIEKSFDIVVLPKSSSSLITFDGVNSLNENIFESNFATMMEINFSQEYSLGKTLTVEDIILTYDETKVESVNLVETENDSGIYKYNLEIVGLNDSEFNLKATINYGEAKNYYSEINLNKIVDLKDLNVNLEGVKDYIKLNSVNAFSIKVTPNDFANYNLNVYLTNNNISVQSNSGVYYLKGLSVGQNTLVVEVEVDGEVIKTHTQTINVINPPTSINFSESTKNYGIEDLLTIGNQNIVDGSYEINKHVFGFTTSVNLDNIEFSSSDENVAKFVDGELVIYEEGRVTLTATETESKLLGLNVSCSIEVRCVKGVSVGSYEDLVKATEDSKQVVLTGDIMLGEKLIEVNENGTTTLLKSKSECERILKQEIHQMKTTSEWNFYKNGKNYTEAPLINYIIKFTNNCYGNGYLLNANNITNMIDGSNALYDFAQFRGPLDLVSIAGASVKAQDNICFVASENVMLNNVELVGADMRGSETSDLNQLNFVGTVLEVMGDNVKIVNSRIRNGRNCVRVYGKEYDNLEKINVLIESCIISNAREFLIKMGTNKKLYGNYTGGTSINLADGNLDAKYWEECAPKLGDFTHLNDASLSETEYKNLLEQYNNSETFEELINTELTLKNSVLHTSGLFSIGIESSFAGPALDGARWNSYNFSNYGWIDIAGTSYPTRLNLEGNVKIYDWKKLSNIDSSILIDGDLFNLDLSVMINNLYNEGKFNDIITVVDGEKYAHGGIVMYGGGKNYSLVNLNNQEEALNNYVVSLDSLNSSLTTMLKYASGKEPFRIFMYGKNSSFNYYKQVNDMQSGVAFSNIGKYTN